MPRTKVSKTTSKRARSTIDEKLEELEELVETHLNQIEEDYSEMQSEISSEIHRITTTLPASLLKTKLSELEAMGIQNLSELKNSVTHKSSHNSIDSQTSITGVPSSTRVSSRATNSDDGYLTHGDDRSFIQSFKSHQIQAPPLLAPARKRRSRSATNIYTPQGTKLLVPNKGGPKRMTPMSMSHVRDSRSKYRTPVIFGRPKAYSADRVITPKVQPNTPIAVLRHARAGETVFSLTGSPVFATGPAELTANVNIPMGDAFLSVRPAEMGNIDPNYIKKINPKTFADLKKLQENLNRLMQYANLDKQE